MHWYWKTFHLNSHITGLSPQTLQFMTVLLIKNMDTLVKQTPRVNLCLSLLSVPKMSFLERVICIFVSISKCARLNGASCCLCFSVGLSAISGENKFAPWDDPKVWHVLYADPVTCDSSVPALEDVTFTLQMLNPDSGGKPVIHCGCDETGSFLLSVILL